MCVCVCVCFYASVLLSMCVCASMWVNPPHLTKQMDSTSQILMQLPMYSCLHIRRHLTIYYFNNLNGLGDTHC